VAKIALEVVTHLKSPLTHPLKLLGKSNHADD